MIEYNGIMKGKVAIVTGGGSGIGRATCNDLASLGVNVIVADVNEYGAQKTCGNILENGFDAIALKVDVSVKSEVRDMVDFAIDRFGRIDILINNAGIGGSLSFMEDYSDDSYEEVIAVNQTGIWYCMKAVLPIMKKQEDGAIVNVSSVAGISAAPRMSAYAASKHAVVGLTRAVASEYGKFNIRVNAVCPTVTDTEMGRSYINENPEALEAVRNLTPMRRFGTADEVARFISWLAGDQNTFITGQVLPIDGGLTS